LNKDLLYKLSGIRREFGERIETLFKSRASGANQLRDQPTMLDRIFHQLVAGVSPLRKKERRNEVVVDRIIHRD